jgi:hypothetical protein
MITRDDLKVLDIYKDGSDETTWAKVEYDNKRYILTATNVTDEVLARVELADPLVSLFLDMGMIPRYDNGVFRGDENWEIIGECNEECEKGVCTKRLASDRDPATANIDHSFEMLLRYLNN